MLFYPVCVGLCGSVANPNLFKNHFATDAHGQLPQKKDFMFLALTRMCLPC